MCSCCGGCDKLFPAHNWKECPYMPYNKKVVPSADQPPVSPIAKSLEAKKLSSFPVAFNGSYSGRISPANPGSSMHQMYSFSSCIKPTEPSTWLIPWHRCIIIMIITRIIAWFVYSFVVPSSSSPEHARHLMSHLNQCSSCCN